MKKHRSTKCYNRRLTLWVDQFLLFIFEIERLPGTKMRLVDYVLRAKYSTQKTHYVEQLVLAKLDLVKRSPKSCLLINSKCESVLPQIEANYQPTPKTDEIALKNANFFARKEGMKVIHASSQFGTKVRSSVKMKKIG